MRRRRAIAGLAATGLLLLTACAGPPAARRFVLGIDGMDPEILGRLMAAGRMPHFQQLADRGRFVPLATTMPPQSPVAWSTFITGLPPAGHGIFDFVHRDPADLTPYLSTSRPSAAGPMELLRRGAPFWDLLVASGIRATIFRVPANFPPSPDPSGWPACRCLRAFSGMGTPDLLGTYGTFTLFTDGPYRIPPTVEGAGAELTPGGDLEVPGGRVVSLALDDGETHLAISGPELDGRPRTAQGRLHVDRSSRAVHLELGGQDVVLRCGEWSPWLTLDFGRAPGRLRRVRGIVRLYLRGVSPLWLYATPVNLDPRDPLMPISVPADGAAQLAAATGPHYTQGMPADTKALSAQVFDEGEFLAQVELTLQETERHLDAELARFESGLLFFYVHSLDQVCHMLWRAAAADHPGHRPDLDAFARAIDDHYARMDALLGRALDGLERAGSGPADVLVLSDHGFAPFARAANLNRWLLDEGYLALRLDAPAEPEVLAGDVEWSATRAYALGLNGLYLNLAGRELRGVVTPDEAPQLAAQIAARLLQWRDPRTGAAVVRRVYPAGAEGDLALVAPDLLVGYARGYRASGASALGRVEADVVADNLAAWSGDHCMAAEEVPGVLLSSRPLTRDRPGLADVPVTILRSYGIAPAPGMDGRSFWEQD